jgi:hypothetical protein
MFDAARRAGRLVRLLVATDGCDLRPCRAVSRRTRFDSAAVRRAGLVLALVALFLTVGLPRFLSRDDSGGSSPGARFVSLCRAHGGTPGTTGGQRRCTVRYGGRTYLMDAITPGGFDADTARLQREGCEQAAASAQSGEAFVYHADTGVCERRS